METLAILVAVILVLIIAVCIYAATRPDEFRIQRTAAIQAPPGAIFPLLEDLHRWEAWSPFEKLDPNLRREFSGAASGKGAVYAWEGNNKAGKGRMEIVEEAAPSRLLIKLDFLKPFQANNMAEFTLVPSGTATNVTWAMYGRSPFPMKVMKTFINMDKMVGRDFETGLANIRKIVER